MKWVELGPSATSVFWRLSIDMYSHPSLHRSFSTIRVVMSQVCSLRQLMYSYHLPEAAVLFWLRRWCSSQLEGNTVIVRYTYFVCVKTGWTKGIVQTTTGPYQSLLSSNEVGIVATQLRGASPKTIFFFRYARRTCVTRDCLRHLDMGWVG